VDTIKVFEYRGYTISIARNGSGPSVNRFYVSVQSPQGKARRTTWGGLGLSYHADEAAVLRYLLATRAAIDAKKEATAQKQATRRQSTAQGVAECPITEGTVLYASWGYEQTNINYWQVTRRMKGGVIEVRPIAADSRETGSMVGECMPRRDVFTGPAERHRIGCYGAPGAWNYYVSWKSLASMYIWNGEKNHWTAYA
jgi:hypothetical protein